jgi:hypothetical protein
MWRKVTQFFLQFLQQNGEWLRLIDEPIHQASGVEWVKKHFNCCFFAKKSKREPYARPKWSGDCRNISKFA